MRDIRGIVLGGKKCLQVLQPSESKSIWVDVPPSVVAEHTNLNPGAWDWGPKLPGQSELEVSCLRTAVALLVVSVPKHRYLTPQIMVGYPHFRRLFVSCLGSTNWETCSDEVRRRFRSWWRGVMTSSGHKSTRRNYTRLCSGDYTPQQRIGGAA